MNYRHAFHAGNFADVLKHAVLVRILLHLRAKPAAFRVIDTHAGPGLYDLLGDEATRTGEWQGGIGRLLDRALEPGLAEMLQPYLAAIEAANPNATPPRHYPGSPWIARHLLRRQDRQTAVELHPEAGGGRRLVEALSRRGLLAKDTHENTVRFAPPLVITRSQVDWAVAQIADAIGGRRGRNG